MPPSPLRCATAQTVQRALSEKALDRPTYIFGAGETGQKTFECFDGKMEIAGYLDNNPALAGKTLTGIPIWNPRDRAVMNAAPFVIIASVIPQFVNAMRQECISLGYPSMSYQELAIAANDDYTDAWADDQSRDVYTAMTRFLKSQHSADLPPMSEPQYFQPFVPPRYYRSFVDGGAYTGDTYAMYKKFVGNDFDEYWAFEPNQRVFGNLLAAVDGDERVKAFNCALSDNEGTRQFLHGAQEYGSRLSAFGNDTVECVALDDAIAGSAPSFIKLDVEGAELPALAGAAKTIAAARPALAICVYHDPFHLWSVPALVRSLLPESKLYLRHHSKTKYETVCYAVP